VSDARFIAELDQLEALVPEWDALAVSCSLPLMSPGWMLPWWRHLAPKGALLRALEVRDGAALVGLVPFFVTAPGHGGRVAYRLLGSGSGAPLALLVPAGREQQVVQAATRALSKADPRPDLIEFSGTRLSSQWHTVMRDCWPSAARPISCAYRVQACPTVSLKGASLEAWLLSRSSKLRSSMRRLARRFAEQGGTWRMSTESTLRSDLKTFQRLHASRWRRLGESSLVTDEERVGAMLNDAGAALVGDERFRLWLMEIDGEAIAADLYLAAGETVLGINGGWDERWKRLSPPLLATLHTIADSIERGESRLGLGPGGGSYKTRFADSDSPVASSVLMVPRRRLPMTMVLTAPTLVGGAARTIAERALRPEHVSGLRKRRHEARQLVLAFRRWRNGCRRRQRPRPHRTTTRGPRTRSITNRRRSEYRQF
jgi:CelD/BcsL family acetyltransferase involved in cellulose biosynthesis